MTQRSGVSGQKELPSRSFSPFALRLLPIVWVLLLAWVSFFNHLGSTGLLDETEPLFAEAARQMTVTGDWITPYFNGVTRFDKPPLIYWLIAIAYQTIGPTAFAARLPSALAGSLLVGLCFYVLNKKNGNADAKAAWSSSSRQTTLISPPFPLSSFSPRLPYLATAMLALNTQMLFFGRTGYSDMLLNLCFGGSLLAFWQGYGQPDRPPRQRRWYGAMYSLMALGVLTKGPVSVVLPGAIILLFLLSVGQLRQGLRELRVMRGGLLFLAIALPWYLLVWWRNGTTFVEAFFGTHNFERFTNVVNDHRGPWYYHLLILAVGFLPWSLYLPVAIAHVLRQRPWRQADRTQHLGLLALIWLGVVMGFFTIAVTKYFSYSLPAVLAGAILVAGWWRQVPTGRSGWGFKVSLWASVLVSFALAAAAGYSPHWLMTDPTMPNLGLRVEQAGLAWIGSGIWGATAIVGLGLALTRNLPKFWLVQLVGFAAFILWFVTPALGLIDAERQLPLRQIAETIRQVRQPQEVVLMASEQFEKPSLVFYSQQPIAFFDRPQKARPYLAQLPQTADTQTALMVITPDALDQLVPQRYQLIQTVGIYQLIRIPLKGAL
jgi:4-amino-4-deoxy-L-arabinose transferase-like glycosyltransferase